jgi:hypothetical protein
MAIKTIRNLYPGINPHCNSQLQTPGNDEMLNQWPSFHGDHITDIGYALNRQLLPRGYYATSESSMQLRLIYLASGIEDSVRTRRPDVAVLAMPGAQAPAAMMTATHPTLTLELDDPNDDPNDMYMAVVIRTLTGDELVTRIELLSPSNKPGQGGYAHYDHNRTEALKHGASLVELDYLHEFRPIHPGVPRYPDKDTSHAYALYVTRAPAFGKGARVDVYGFDAASAFPIIGIPLRDDDSLIFDLGTVYRHTFEQGGWGIRSGFVDYAAQPVRFDSYSPADRARILRHMASIAAAVARGDDLETAEIT